MIDRPELDALERSTELARRALRAEAAFLWTASAQASALLCSSGPAGALDRAACDAIALLGDKGLATRSPVRHNGGSHAWLAIALRLGAQDGGLCVAAPAPRDFDDHESAVLEAIGMLVETLAKGPALPLQAIVDLSGTLLRQAQEGRPAMPAEAMRAAADSLDSVAARLRELTAPPVSPAAAGERARILLADDLDLNRRLIADMLSLDGHRVDCVTDGAAAVRAVAAERYDLVLMDMVMPEMDGLAATRAIRALPKPARDVPIVALTANAMRDQLDSCLAAGMDAALTKPMSLDALTAAVALWTRGRHAA